MRVRIGVIAVLLFVAVGFVSSASACEKCIAASTPGWTQCSSGYASGKAYCYGGFGTACTADGACGSGGTSEIDYPDYLVSVKPCLTCAGDEPAQGFVLRSDGASAETLVRGSVQRGKLTRSGRR